MSRNKGTVPDAWDDDWDKLADKAASPEPEPESGANLSKAERLVRHEEANKQLWESADAPEDRPLWLDIREDAPKKSEFKPTVKVLSRKPPPKVASADPSGAMAGLNVNDDEDSEEEERKRAAESFAERQARAQREREEKQRKYQEVRERLFGSLAPNNSEAQAGTSSVNGRNSSRGKGRSRGAGNQGTSSNDQYPARPPSQKKELYDPGYSAKPGSLYIQRRDAKVPTEQRNEEPVRAPRGPDGSGRGGHGFGPRKQQVE